MKVNLKINMVWFGVMVIGFVVIDGLELMGVINLFIENMLVMIGINVILVVGFNLIIGFVGQFLFGYVGFMVIGVYVIGIMI